MKIDELTDMLMDDLASCEINRITKILTDITPEDTIFIPSKGKKIMVFIQGYSSEIILTHLGKQIFINTLIIEPVLQKILPISIATAGLCLCEFLNLMTREIKFLSELTEELNVYSEKNSESVSGGSEE